jgi:glycosyltransferase involved in cell wall biosynthesis
MALVQKSSAGRQAKSKPLITFAVLAFNQTRYIHKAIEGALAQDYEPLEIIFSDDCSDDHTVELIQQITKNYSGPHTLICRRTKTNLGTYGHLLDVAAIAKGFLLVLAAGDDISKPGRVSEIYETWQRTGAWALHSRYDLISEDGCTLAQNLRSDSLLTPNCELRSYFYETDGPVEIVHGATSAYDTRLVALAPKNSAGIVSEDGVLTLVANAMNLPVAFIDVSLVHYRQHDEAISNVDLSRAARTLRGSMFLLKRDRKYSKNIYSRALIAKSIANSPCSRRALNQQNIERDLILYGAVSSWDELPLFKRLQAVLHSLMYRRPGLFIPLLLGERVGAFYLFCRSYFRDQQRKQ